MPTFSELQAQHAASWKRISVREFFVGSPDVSTHIESFFEKYNFNDLRQINSGSNAIILQDIKNPLLLFRIALDADADQRVVAPQMLQPLHVEVIDGMVKIELLQNITPAIPEKEFMQLLADYSAEINTSGYRLMTRNLRDDVDVFTYDDPAHPGQKKSVVMGTDASLIPYEADYPPTCTANYPTLEIQWQEQCKMVASDPRLQNLLGGLPKELPSTRIKSSQSRQKRASQPEKRRGWLL